MIKQKTKVNDTLEDFLFRKIERSSEFQEWSKTHEIPRYISDNLHPEKKLRPYQEGALKHFIWLWDVDRDTAKHLLFNMATGTGKTLVMAGVVLFLYEKGYRNFLFLVHQVNILDQAKENFTNYKFNKYLFNPRGVNINGQKIDISIIDNISDSNRNGINFLFYSTSLLYNRLKEDRENGITADDFVENDIVVIADEAHRLNVNTRSKSKRDKEEILNWETAVMTAIHARANNILLEFTATVDLANEAIHAKYTDKLVYRYSFLEFNKDRYCKDVKFLYNQEVHTEDQKRLLIVNAVALSEFRRLFAERSMNWIMKPVVLIKSTKIAASESDRVFFDQVVGSLRPEDLNRLKEIGKENTDREHEILSDMFNWIDSKKSGLRSEGDWDGLKAFVSEIRSSFSPENTLIYNSQKKEKAELMAHLDSERNNVRAIFSVNALNEGWDVLSLYDTIHFDISESKKVSLQDIQLIGRGARYCPYELPKSYQRDEDSAMNGLFAMRNLEFDKYKRKFDSDPFDTGRVLETFVYHFVKTGTFLEKLQGELLGEGIINEGVEKKTISMKETFLDSDTYKKGFVLVNRTIKRKKTKESEIDTTFNRTIKAGSYNLRARGISDYEENQIIADQKTDVIRISEKFFSLAIIRKALVSSESNFFRFNNLSKHVVDIKSVDDLIEQYLPLYEIKYTYEIGKAIDQLKPKEKLQLLTGVILPEVRIAIDKNMPIVTGSNVFRPVPLASIFSQEKNIYLTSFPSIDAKTGEKVFISSDERAKAQSDHDNSELQYDVCSADWYAYDENFGTSEEKKFVKYVASQVSSLREKYQGAEIYLIRNELEYWLFGLQDGSRFSPDYLLIINDVVNDQLYYQCLIEPKGGHILEKDLWKEESLMIMSEDSKVVFDTDESDAKIYCEYLKEVNRRGYKEIKCLGFKFYNSDARGEEDFALDFQNKLLD